MLEFIFFDNSHIKTVNVKLFIYILTYRKNNGFVIEVLIHPIFTYLKNNFKSPMCVNRFLETKWDKPEKFEKWLIIVAQKIMVAMQFTNQNQVVMN